MTTNPQMIVLAREAAGLTQSALAHAVGISQAHLSKVEHGLDDPAEALLVSLARECDVPADFFEQTDQIVGEGLVDFFHRKRLTLPAKPLRRAQGTVNRRRLEVLRLLRSIEFTDVQPFPSVGDRQLTPAEAAQATRLTWRIPAGPLPNLVGLLEAAGVPVLLADLGHDKLSAITMPGLAGRHLIVLNQNQAASTQRFTLAHELGHLVLHHGALSDDMEREADEFASELLMPAADIGTSLRALRFHELGGLKATWRVSMASLIYRTKALGFLTDRQYRTFWMNLNQLPGGRRNEPGEFEREQPKLLDSVIEHYRRELGYSDDDLARTVVTTVDSFRRDYLGIETGTIHAVGHPLRSVRLSASN